MRRVLVDTGPLVAILSSRDQHHRRCVDMLRNLPAPLFSCWAVMTEAAWLLRSSPQTVEGLLQSVNGGFLELLPLSGEDARGIARVMEKYQSMQPPLADATLIYLADRDDIDTVFTLDQRDFSVYRSRRKQLKIIPEF